MEENDGKSVLDDQLMREAIRRLEAAGVGFVAGDDTAGQEIRLDGDLMLFLADRELYFAGDAGMSREVYRRFKEWYSELQCTGTTRDGKRCRRGAGGQESLPHGFVFGRDDRCPLHQVDANPDLD